MFYRVLNFIIFFYIHAFRFCARFSRFCEKQQTCPMKITRRDGRVLHDIRRLFSSRCEIASYKEREKKGADQFYQDCITQRGCPLFRSREAKCRECIRLLINAGRVIWLRYVFVSYCFCNCYNVYGMRARHTDGDGARNIKCKRQGRGIY